MNLKNMRECDNSKIHISSNCLLSICLLIMLDTLLLVPSIHCNTSLHFTKLHFTTLIDTSLPLIYTSLLSHLAQPINIPYRSISPPITKLDTVLFSHPQTYFQRNEPLHCPKELLSISLHFTLYFVFIYFFTYPINPSIHFTLLFASTNHFPCLHFLLFNAFTSPSRLHFPHIAFTWLTLILVLQIYNQGYNILTVLFNLSVASCMLPQRVVTFVPTAHHEMATLLSFCILGMPFMQTLTNTGPSRLPRGIRAGWAASWTQNFCLSVNCCKGFVIKTVVWGELELLLL
jgi:hypothetical protein